jgi:hypothetical protein
VIFVSNNATKSRDTYVSKFSKMGLENVEINQIFSAGKNEFDCISDKIMGERFEYFSLPLSCLAYAAALYLKSLNLKGSIYCAGVDGLSVSFFFALLSDYDCCKFFL